ncbi:hypothetical protein BV20DRAFT_811672 [Pilatotrama ljubarskyi]|nr:hypothetical protein BV20DRAFT_811672 [Pilatotrama ljubarskyi]
MMSSSCLRTSARLLQHQQQTRTGSHHSTTAQKETQAEHQTSVSDRTTTSISAAQPLRLVRPANHQIFTSTADATGPTGRRTTFSMPTTLTASAQNRTDAGGSAPRVPRPRLAIRGQLPRAGDSRLPPAASVGTGLAHVGELAISRTLSRVPLRGGRISSSTTPGAASDSERDWQGDRVNILPAVVYRKNTPQRTMPFKISVSSRSGDRDQNLLPHAPARRRGQILFENSGALCDAAAVTTWLLLPPSSSAGSGIPQEAASPYGRCSPSCDPPSS